MAEPDLLLIGCGNMGGALAAGYTRRSPQARLLVVDPDTAKAHAAVPGATVVATLAEVGEARPAMTVLAVKPQSMAAMLPMLAPLPAASGLVVSIAAGTSTGSIRAVLPGARVVRAMPNTPAAVGRGATGLWGGAEVTAGDRALCEALFAAVGLASWVSDEAAIDAVTALSGSGPAYVFAVCEAMAQAGAALGLPPDTAAGLARATLIGAAAMLEHDATDPAQLKANVRSPQGTTDAALKVFEAGGALHGLFGRAIRAAFDRAVALQAAR